MKKATYNHCDSYPERLGLYVVRFIKSLSEDQIQQMIQNLEKIEWYDVSKNPITQNADMSCRVDEYELAPEEIKNRYIVARFHRGNEVKAVGPKWYAVLWNVQGDIALPHILDGTLNHLTDNIDTTWMETVSGATSWTGKRERLECVVREEGTLLRPLQI